MVDTILPLLSTLDKWSLTETLGIHNELESELKNYRTQFLAEIRLDLRGKMKSIAHTLLYSSCDFMMTLLIHTDADISILLGQGFSEKNIFSLLSDQTRHIYDNLYLAYIIGRYKLGSSTVDKTAHKILIIRNSD